MIPNYWSNKYYITKKKLTKTQMEELGLEYDGWGQAPGEKKEYYYIRRRMYMRPRRGIGRGRGDDRFGRKDASQYGWKRGGRGRNRTEECRHPEKKRRR